MAQNLAAAPIGTTEVISSPIYVQPTVTQPPALVTAPYSPEEEESGGTRWWVVVIVLIIIAIIIGIIIWLAVLNRTSDDRKLNESCDDRNKCVSGLVCQSGVCKAAIGTSCSSRTDCVSSATGCTNGVCVTTTEGGLNDPCNNSNQQCGSGLTCTNGSCKSKIGQTCTRLSDCVSSATACQRGVCVDTQGGLNQRCPCQSGFVCDGSTDFCKRPNGSMCSASKDCLTGSTCQSGVCTPISNGGGGVGAVCRTDTNCSGSLICVNGRCEDPNCHHKRHHHHRRYDTSYSSTDDRRFDYRDDVDDDRAGDDSLFGLGGPSDNLGPPCQSQNQSGNEGCPQGMFCGGSSIDVGATTTTGVGTSSMIAASAYTFKDVVIDDIVTYNGQNYLLTSRGDVLLDTGSSIVSVQSDLQLDRLAVFGQSLYAISSGRLYENICDNISQINKLRWRCAKWAPDSLLHISTSNDSYWLWLQADISQATTNNFAGSSMNRGYLYQYQGENYRPRLVETTDLDIGVFRVYGRNNSNYLQINTLQQEAQLMPSARIFSGVSDGVILNNGDVALLLASDADLYKNVSLINDAGYYISRRRCQQY